MVTLRNRIEAYPLKQRRQKPDQSVLTIRLEPDLHVQIRKSAADEGVSMNWLARVLLEDGIERLRKKGGA